MDPATRRIAAFRRWLSDAAATRSEPWRFGTALFDDDHTTKWDANFLRVERPVGDATAEELQAEADRLQAHLGHREFVFPDDGEGARLAAAFVERGYTSDRMVEMVLRRDPDRAGPLPAEEAGFEAIRDLSLLVTRESFPVLDETAAAMLVAYDGDLVDRMGTRFFMARVDGHPAGYCQLFEHDGVAQVEDVNTLAAYRNRGVARSFVSAAIEAAREGGAEIVFLDADDADWPKRLYGKVGFDEVGHHRQFTLPPPGTATS